MTLEEEKAIRERCRKPNKGRFEGGLTLYDCPVCGKTFCIHCESSWVYKRGVYCNNKHYRAFLYICSYPCTRKYDAVFGK